MNFEVKFEEDAKFDIAEAYDWYFQISENLGERFLSEIGTTAKYLEKEPHQFKIFTTNSDKSR